MIKWDEIRRQFPVTAETAYLNTAAAGPLALSTSAAAAAYYRQMTEDGDQHWDEWLARREEIRSGLARFINAEPDEIGLTTNTSSGMNAIVDALWRQGSVISCDLEFPVSTITWMHRGTDVDFVKAEDGVVHLDRIRNAMHEKSRIISLSHVQFSNGFRFDLDALGQIKRDHFLVVNASQSAGAFTIDVKHSGIDALCATGHKWMLAGYGSGFVYLSRRVQSQAPPRAISWLSVDDPYAMLNAAIHLRNDAAARVELGCPHFAGMFALGASAEMIMKTGIDDIQSRVLQLNHYLTGNLTNNGWKVLSPLGDEAYRSGETLVAIDNPAPVVAELAQRGVAVTEKPQGIRVATDFFNNEEDVDRLLQALKEIRR